LLVGLFIPSYVPYFSWKITHTRHRRFTGHIEKDTVFVPYMEEKYSAKIIKAGGLGKVLEDAPLMTALSLLGHQLFGFSIYLLFNVSAGKGSIPLTNAGMDITASHFNPHGKLFIPSKILQVVLFDTGIALVVYILALVDKKKGLEKSSAISFHAIYVGQLSDATCSCHHVKSERMTSHHHQLGLN
jgi:omega-6 fatty acid desaturase (delta-12 desaturase)